MSVYNAYLSLSGTIDAEVPVIEKFSDLVKVVPEVIGKGRK